MHTLEENLFRNCATQVITDFSSGFETSTSSGSNKGQIPNSFSAMRNAIFSLDWLDLPWRACNVKRPSKSSSLTNKSEKKSSYQMLMQMIKAHLILKLLKPLNMFENFFPKKDIVQYFENSMFYYLSSNEIPCHFLHQLVFQTILQFRI